jgi:hypothetical protein
MRVSTTMTNCIKEMFMALTSMINLTGGGYFLWLAFDKNLCDDFKDLHKQYLIVTGIVLCALALYYFIEVVKSLGTYCSAPLTASFQTVIVASGIYVWVAEDGNKLLDECKWQTVGIIGTIVYIALTIIPFAVIRYNRCKRVTFN